jgi:DUF2950 family protein
VSPASYARGPKIPTQFDVVDRLKPIPWTSARYGWQPGDHLVHGPDRQLSERFSFAQCAVPYSGYSRCCALSFFVQLRLVFCSVHLRGVFKGWNHNRCIVYPLESKNEFTRARRKAGGLVYQKDLGKKTETLGKAMQEYDLDPTWKKAVEEPLQAAREQKPQ